MQTTPAPLAPAKIASASPTEIDTFLAEVYQERGTAARAFTSAQLAEGRILDAAEGRELSTIEQRKLESIRERMNAARTRLDELIVLAGPAEDRYSAERWTRAFLVDSSQGHVHSSMHCSTCFSTTTYVWLPELSGSDEEVIVQMAGERACTVCYPSAPVEILNRPTQLFTPSEKDAQKRREERAAKKAAADAKKLHDPRTGDLLVGEYGSPFKTERGAELAALDGMKSLAWYGEHPSAQEWIDLANLVAYAKSAKHGTDAAAEFDTLKAKAAKSAGREGAEYIQALTDLTYTAPDGA